jgi:RNA polymerase sigma-70 factor (ECF subfamily)
MPAEFVVRASVTGREPLRHARNRSGVRTAPGMVVAAKTRNRNDTNPAGYCNMLGECGLTSDRPLGPCDVIVEEFASAGRHAVGRASFFPNNPVRAMTSTPGTPPGPDRPDDDLVTFADFFRRIRAGDDQAAEELVRRYEPALRLEIRLRLTDPKLRRILEPADLCQSVLKSFFLRAATGQFDLDTPEKLLALLRTMARNKVANQVRKQQALRRDIRRDVSLDDSKSAPVAAEDPSPSRIAIGRELVDALHVRLSAEERRIADLRSQGCEWAEIARELGGTPQARRKQLARAVDRISQELGLDEVDHEPD